MPFSKDPPPRSLPVATTVLQRVDTADLHDLALSKVPAALQGRCVVDALPPDFVARRALELQQAAPPGGLAGAIYYIVHNEQVVGSCGFKDAAADGWVEVGYGIAAAHRRRGLGTEAVRSLCQLALDSGLVAQVRACIAPDNLASIALAERLGFEPGCLVTEADGSRVVVWTLTGNTAQPG